MGPPYALDEIARFFSGRLVEIIAGPENQIYQIHARALSESDSPSLRALISERWDPTVNKVIDWSHTDAATVERFFTYLYTGNYHIPDPEPIPVKSASAQDVVEKSSSPIPIPVFDGEVLGEPDVNLGSEAEVGLDNALEPDAVPEDSVLPVVEVGLKPGSETDTDLDVQRVLIETFEMRPLTPLDTFLNLPPVDNGSKGQPANTLDGSTFPHIDYSYTKPVLAIARLYCFATYHMSSSLQQSALRRLLNIITQMDSTQPHAASELAQLTQIVYDNTTSALTQTDAMRNLISQFVALNYASIMHDELEHVLIQGGDFAQDVARKLRRSALAKEKAQSKTSRQLEEVQDRLTALRMTGKSCKNCSCKKCVRARSS